MALRELALRFLADETEEELLDHLKSRQTNVLWDTSEHILVGITAAPGTDTIVRRVSRMASRIKADLHVLHIISGEDANRSDNNQLVILKQLTTDVGLIGTKCGLTIPPKRSLISPVPIRSPRSWSGRVAEVVGKS
jgi:two-component system sensor histidine kinase KdpD